MDLPLCWQKSPSRTRSPLGEAVGEAVEDIGEKFYLATRDGTSRAHVERRAKRRLLRRVQLERRRGAPSAVEQEISIQVSFRGVYSAGSGEQSSAVVEVFTPWARVLSQVYFVLSVPLLPSLLCPCAPVHSPSSMRCPAEYREESFEQHPSSTLL